MLDISMDRRLLTLLQLCDSNFPTGAFSHSFGMETYIQEERIYNKKTFAEWLKVYLEKQLVFTDGLACRLVYEAMERNDLEFIWQLDRVMVVQNISRESREASRRMGERMIQLGTELFSCPTLALYREKTNSRATYGQPSIVFAVIAHHLEIEKRTAVLSFLYSSMATLVQNGVRGIPLGQTDGQRLLLELQSLLMDALKTVEELDFSDLGAVSPGLELAQIRHERLNIRLFMS